MRLTLIVVAVIWGGGLLIMLAECRRLYDTWPYANGLYQVVTRPVLWIYNRI